MKNECHKLAEHVLRYPAKTEAERWIRSQIAQNLVNHGNVGTWTNNYAHYLEEEEVLNPYLRELTMHYQEDN